MKISNSWEESNIEGAIKFEKFGRGSLFLVYDGYRYSTHGRTKKSNRWVCSLNKSCKEY